MLAIMRCIYCSISTSCDKINFKLSNCFALFRIRCKIFKFDVSFAARDGLHCNDFIDIRTHAHTQLPLQGQYAAKQMVRN